MSRISSRCRAASLLLVGGVPLLTGCRISDTAPAAANPVPAQQAPSPQTLKPTPTPAPRSQTRQERIVAAARRQIGDSYRADYVALGYPGGDVPAGTGACTDVVIRSLRSVGVDLQQLVHQDMKKHFSSYPRRWGLSRPDHNIDHRRLPNLTTFWKRSGKSLPTAATTGTAGSTWRPGDVVVWKLENGRDHCGIVTDTTGASGLPTVVHNLSRCVEEDCLTAWTITGHYRL